MPLRRVEKKKLRALLLGLAKSIYLSLKIVGQKNLEKKKKDKQVAITLL